MNYVVFIISHERADRVETYDTLREVGYTGEIMVVIDNEDRQRNLYQERFGDELLVFSKEEQLESSDTLGFNMKSSALYARKYVEAYAESSGLLGFMLIDDDVTSLRYRWIEDSKVRSIYVSKNLGRVIDMYFDFLISNDMAAISFSNVMLYVGGAEEIESRITDNREMYQVYFRNCKHRFDWRSIMNEDLITELECARHGEFLWSLPFVVYDCPKMNTKPGGLKEAYNTLSEFQRAFLAVMVLPGVCRIGETGGHMVIKRNRKGAYPMLISSRYKL